MADLTRTSPAPSGSPSPVSVLAVDDVPDNLDVLGAVLAQPGLTLLRASGGTEALELLLEHDDVAVALLDVHMPEMDGFELAELMRGAERTRHVPIIFVTAGAPESARLFRGYEAGAVDFLFKPLDISLVRSKVNVFLELFRQRQLLAAQLEEHRQLLRMSELLFGVLGHDLRTPLGAIVSSAEVLRLKSGDDAALQRIAETIKTASGRMTRLISQLLDFGAARLGNLPMHPRPSDLAVLCEMAIAELEGRRQFDVVTVGDTSGTWDPDRLLQVISNLLGNAIQHGERDAPVEVAVSGSDPATVVLEVSNAGALPVDSAGALFMPFATSNATTRGTGLGLYIVDQIVKAHGGVTGGESKHGRTCFTVRLPRHRASAQQSSGGAAQLAVPPR